MRHFFTCSPTHPNQHHLRILLLIIISSYIQGVLSQFHQQSSLGQQPQKTFCRFKNKEYAPGDVWYPTSSNSYGANCVICTCLNSGRQNCTRQECPSDCQYDKPFSVQHPCCKVCEERESDSSQSGQMMGGGIGGNNGGMLGHQLGSITASDHESGEEEDEDGDLVTENSEFVSCLHQGKIYRDGESFTANVSGLPISVTDQCMQCICQSGMVLCQMKSCSSFKCSSGGSSSSSTGFSLTTGSNSGVGTGASSQASIEACCQRCAVWKTSSNKQPRSETTNSHRGSSGGGDDDSYASKTIVAVGSPTNTNSRDGRIGDQTSRPVVETGANENSFESSITFRDVGFNIGAGGNSIGGNDHLVTKDKLSSQFDDCISAGRYYMHGSIWHPIIGPFGTMECVTCKCNRGQIDCGRLKCPLKKEMPCAKPVKVEGHCCPICVSMISNDGSKMCVSGKQEVTAMRSHGIGTNATELINFAFIKLRRIGGGGTGTAIGPQVDLHEWILRDGEIIQFSTKYISLQEFQEIKTRQTFTLLGATNEKNLDKFTRREKKLEKRCSARCSARISSLERSLRIHRLIARKQCQGHERAVNT